MADHDDMTMTPAEFAAAVFTSAMQPQREELNNKSDQWCSELIFLRLFAVDLVLGRTIRSHQNKDVARNLEQTRVVYNAAIKEFATRSPFGDTMLDLIGSRIQDYAAAAGLEDGEGSILAVASQFAAFLDGREENHALTTIVEAGTEFQAFSQAISDAINATSLRSEIHH
jgi:hypothetical protein